MEVEVARTTKDMVALPGTYTGSWTGNGYVISPQLIHRLPSLILMRTGEPLTYMGALGAEAETVGLRDHIGFIVDLWTSL